MVNTDERNVVSPAGFFSLQPENSQIDVSWYPTFGGGNIE